MIRILAAISLVLSGFVPAAAASDPLQTFYSQTLSWKTCYKTLECASYKAPLDYRNPSGRSIVIAVARSKATGNARGNLVLNPGGPGGSGIGYIRDPAAVATPTIRREFNLVGFDPRGLHRSTALNCFTDRQLDAFLEVDQTPDTSAEEQALVKSSQQLITACKQADAELMQHVSTAEVARDMDILRALLGESRLRYLGKSWGTSLGQAYAALFPDRVGLLVLDGAVDLSLPLSKASFEQAQAFEVAANRFIAWCVARGKCVLGTSRTAARDRLVAFLAQLDTSPLKTKRSARPLTEEQAWTAVIGPLYVSEGGWEWLESALFTALKRKDGTDLQDINDWFMDRSPSGKYGDNGNTLIYAVNCLDRPGAVSLSQSRQQSASWAKQLPLMGKLLGWGDQACATWPYRAQEQVDRLRVRDVPPILVVGTTYDPATPLKWARAVQRAIPGSVLLIRQGDGHTAYVNGSRCIDRIVDAYLMSKNLDQPTLPNNGQRCV